MTSFMTDFETHAIWHGYIEDPAAKDFVARKTHTIALSKAQGSCHKTSNNQPYSQVWKSLEDSIPKLYCVAWLGLGRARKCQFKDFVRKKVMNHVQSNGRLHQKPLAKGGKGKFTSNEATTRFPQASCFEKPMHSVPETWGRMYDILARSANGMRNGMKNQIPVQPRKAQRN
jgi:hypothetical protein